MDPINTTGHISGKQIFAAMHWTAAVIRLYRWIANQSVDVMCDDAMAWKIAALLAHCRVETIGPEQAVEYTVELPVAPRRFTLTASTKVFAKLIIRIEV